MGKKLEQLQQKVVETKAACNAEDAAYDAAYAAYDAAWDAYDADWDSRTAYDDTALTAYCKALQELEDYLEEQDND